MTGIMNAIPSTRLMVLLKKNMSKGATNALTEDEAAELLSVKNQVASSALFMETRTMFSFINPNCCLRVTL